MFDLDLYIFIELANLMENCRLHNIKGSSKLDGVSWIHGSNIVLPLYIPVSINKIIIIQSTYYQSCPITQSLVNTYISQQHDYSTDL